MLNVIGKYDIPGAPAKTAMYCLIGLGVFLVVIACLGMQGAAMRKTQGTEGKGLCLLIIYAVLLFLVILVELVVGIVVFVWIGGSLGPVTEKIQNNEKAKQVVKKGTLQAENFINCLYDGCCATQEINASKFEPVGCFVNDKGYPDYQGNLYQSSCDNDFPCDAPEAISDACNALGEHLLSVATCHSGINKFQSNVADALAEHFRPIGYVAIAVGSTQLALFIMAILQICWCCGESDPVDDWNDDWDDDYDEYGRVVY